MYGVGFRDFFRTIRAMARSARLCVVAVLLGLGILACPGIGQADTKVDFRIGDWTGAVDYIDGSFEACWLVRHYGPTQLLIKVGAGGRLVIALVNDAWDLGTNRRYQLTLQVDQIFERQVTAVARDDRIFMILGEDWDLVAALRAGHHLNVRGNSDPLSFDLKNSSAALQRSLACVARETRSAQGSSNPFGLDDNPNPFATSPTEETVTFGALSEVQTLAIKLMLIAAGIDDPVMLSQDDLGGLTGRVEVPALLAWFSQEDSLFGMLTGWKSDDAQDELNLLVSKVGERCDGRFASKRDHFTHLPDNRKAVQAETACDTGGETQYYNLMVYFTGDHALAFIHVAKGATRSRADEIGKGLVHVLGTDQWF